MKQDPGGFPTPALFVTWEDWGSMLIKQLDQKLLNLDLFEREIILGSTLTTGIATASYTNIGFNQVLHKAQMYGHDPATNNHNVTVKLRGEYVLDADVGFVGTANYDVQLRANIGGVEYGTLARSRMSAEGTWHLQLPLVSVHMMVAKDAVVSLSAQASVAGVSLVAGRSRLAIRRLLS